MKHIDYNEIYEKMIETTVPDLNGIELLVKELYTPGSTLLRSVRF